LGRGELGEGVSELSEVSELMRGRERERERERDLNVVGPKWLSQDQPVRPVAPTGQTGPAQLISKVLV